MQKIHILLPVHNRRPITESFVQCLARQSYRNFHLILIDDGSTDDTADMVESLLPTTTILKGRGNWWWAGSLQRGLDWLNQNGTDDASLVLFINDDLVIEPDYLDRAIRVMQDRRGSFVLSRFKTPNHESPGETGVVADLKNMEFSVPQNPGQINCLSTQGLFAYWGDVRAVGGFHPWLLPHYLSDYEYTIRAWRKGMKCETSAELVVDVNQETTGFHKIDEVKILLFLRKFFSLKSPANPIYFTVFACMVVPARTLVPVVLRIWRDATRTVLRAFVGSIRA